MFHGVQMNLVENVFDKFDEQIENYPYIESVMDFWKDHPEEILESLDEREQNKEDKIVVNYPPMDDAGFRSLPYSEQKELACWSYKRLSQIFTTFVDIFGYKELFCIDITEDNFGMIYFYEKRGVENNTAVLGMKTDYKYLSMDSLKAIQSGKKESDAIIKRLDDGTKDYILYEEIEINGKTKCVNVCIYDWTMSEEYLHNALKDSFKRILVVIAVIMAIAIIYLYKSTFYPLLKIQKNVHSYLNSMDKEKFLKAMDTVRPRNEIGMLSVDLSNMIRKIEEYHAEILRSTEERAKTEYELNIASQVQTAMLPQKLPQPEGYSIAASMNPVSYVAGDFFDAFMTDENHLVLVIADVSGKGLYAALLAASAQTTLRCIARPESRPSELLTRLNNEIIKKNLDKMFVTVWIGIIDTRTGIMMTSNAGHEYPMLNTGGSFEKYKDKHGLPAGAMKKTVYTDHEIDLSKGASVFVYTDGVTEAMNKSGERFGMDRLKGALNENPDMMPDEILKNVKHSVTDSFSNGAEQFDDITMMCVRCLNIEERRNE